MDEEEERIKREKLNKLMSRSNTIENDVDDSNFEEKVIEKSKELPVVVDFWAEWCRPCLVLGPVLESIAEEYKGRFVLVKVNVEKSPKISEKYGIMSIPNVKMFKEGKIVSEFIGAYPEDFVREWLNKNL